MLRFETLFSLLGDKCPEFSSDYIRVGLQLGSVYTALVCSGDCGKFRESADVLVKRNSHAPSTWNIAGRDRSTRSEAFVLGL
jgi:hypothetical protein